MKYLFTAAILLCLVLSMFGEASRDHDGLNDYTIWGSNNAVSNIFATGGTVMAWIKADNLGEGNGGRIAHKASTVNASLGWQFGMDDESTNSFAFSKGFVGGRGKWSTISNTVTFGIWQHVAMTYNSSSNANTPQFYINWVPVSSTNLVVPAGATQSDIAQSLFIGSEGVSASRSFNGCIAYVHLFRRMLSQAEIETMARMPHTVLPGLVFFTELNGRSPERDLSINGLSGGVSNGLATSESGPPVVLHGSY